MAGIDHSEAITSHTWGQGLRFCGNLAFKPANGVPDAYEIYLRDNCRAATCDGAKVVRKHSGTL